MFAARVARFHAAADRSRFLPTFVLLLVPDSKWHPPTGTLTVSVVFAVACVVAACVLKVHLDADALPAQVIGGAIDEHFPGERKDLCVEPTDRTYDIA